MKIFGFLIREFDFFLCQNEALLVLNLNLFSKVYVTFLYRQGDHLKLGHFFEIFLLKWLFWANVMVYGGLRMLLCRGKSGLSFGIKILYIRSSNEVLEKFEVEYLTILKFFFYDFY